jgi:hypothetical protein
VSIVGGGNDVLRHPVSTWTTSPPSSEGAVACLAATGATVLMATSYDPRQAAT